MGTLRIEIPKEEIEAFCRKRWISSRREASAIRSVVRKYFAPLRSCMQPDLRDAGYLLDMIEHARGVLRTVQGRSIAEYLANEEFSSQCARTPRGLSVRCGPSSGVPTSTAPSRTRAVVAKPP